MRHNIIGLTAAAVATAGAVGVAGATIANAADDSTSAASPPASSSTDTLPGEDEGASGTRPGGPGGGPGPGSQDEVVTGDEAQRVIDAVEAEDPSVVVDTVRKDPDGSYDALGTRDDQPVFVEVSADLATVTERRHGRGAPGDGCDGDGPAATDGTDGTGGASGADTGSGSGTGTDASAV